MKNNGGQIRSLSFHLTKILGSNTSHFPSQSSGAFGKNRSSTEVIQLMRGLEEYQI